MLSSFNLTKLPPFVALNWLLTLATLGILGFIYFRHRYLLVKPGLLLICFSHVMLQWPLTLYAGYYETWLPHPYGIVALVHGFIFIGLPDAVSLFRRNAMNVWERLGKKLRSENTSSRSLSQIRLATYVPLGLTVPRAAAHGFGIILALGLILSLLIGLAGRHRTALHG